MLLGKISKFEMFFVTNKFYGIHKNSITVNPLIYRHSQKWAHLIIINVQATFSQIRNYNITCYTYLNLLKAHKSIYWEKFF